MIARDYNRSSIISWSITSESAKSPERNAFLHELADSPQVFKIIITSQPRGSIPTSLWSSSYILFVDR